MRHLMRYMKENKNNIFFVSIFSGDGTFLCVMRSEKKFSEKFHEQKYASVTNEHLGI